MKDQYVYSKFLKDSFVVQLNRTKKAPLTTLKNVYLFSSEEMKHRGLDVHKESTPICWIIPEMPTSASAGQSQSTEPGNPLQTWVAGHAKTRTPLLPKLHTVKLLWSELNPRHFHMAYTCVYRCFDHKSANLLLQLSWEYLLHWNVRAFLYGRIVMCLKRQGSFHSSLHQIESLLFLFA